MGRVAEQLSSALIPKTIRFEFQLASRHLRSGGGQTLLTIGAVATGVTIVIFVTSLIFGLQERQTELLTGNIPHVTVQVHDPSPRSLDSLAGSSNPISSKIEEQAPQLKFIDDWEHVVNTIRELPNVLAAVPVVSGQGIASKGENRIGVGMVGADPALHETITPVTEDLIAGSYTGLGSDEVVIDAELAEDLNVSTDERIRLTSSSGNSDDFIVRGIYSQGRGRGNAYVTLRTGQSLFGYGTSVNSIYVKLSDIYEADAASNTITALTPYEARSWTGDFSAFLSNMRAMGASAYLISIFSLIASAFAIASVLIVSVLQKSAQIGILKAMGARQRQILTVFVLEGLGVAILGSSLGATIGISIATLLSLFTRPPTQAGQQPDQLFPFRIIPFYIGLTVLAAIMSTVIAAVLPARRAAKLNPVEVMRS